jgi:ATP-dependent RNA helicase DDX47/RRP3
VAFVTQYDVEPYQRLEDLIKQKLQPFPADEETVLVLLERVSEAQRIASRELREMQAQDPRKGKKRKGRDEADNDGDQDEGAPMDGGGKKKKKGRK